MIMKQLYDSGTVLITLSSTQEMCQRGKGAQGEIERKREGKREMETDRLTERKSRKAERG